MFFMLALTEETEKQKQWDIDDDNGDVNDDAASPSGMNDYISGARVVLLILTLQSV